jgi:hypothetical protein
MKIAFVGDSFCADANRNFTASEKKDYPTWLSWLELVARKFNAEIICTGHSGRALFHAYEDLLDTINEADYIVLCITKEFRLANKYKIGITPTGHSHGFLINYLSEIEGMPDPSAVAKTLSIAASYYYKEVMSIDFHTTIHYLLIKEIDNILQEKNKKCIWFFVGTHPIKTSYKIKSGPMGDTSLIALYEYNLNSSSSKELLSGYDEKTYHLNHLRVKNNQIMANLIIDVIRNNDFSPRLIRMSDYFKGLKEL